MSNTALWRKEHRLQIIADRSAHCKNLRGFA